MNVLVTGGAGSIGAHVVCALLARGNTVSIVDNFNDFYDPGLKRTRLQKLTGGIGEPRVHEVDITDGEALAAVFREERPDVVLHLAAWPAVRPSVKHPALFTSHNVLGTVNVFQCAVDHGVKGVVFSSSSSVYGRDTPPPYREDAPCDKPIAPYGSSKRAGELYAWMYHYLHGLPVTCLRYFTVYGPWIRPDMATWQFTARIHRGEPIELRAKGPNGEEVRRDFAYIDDIVRGTVTALDRVTEMGFDIINLGNDDPVPLTRLVATIEAGLGKKADVHEVELPPEEAVVTAADITKARERLGFSPTTPVEEGMKRFTAWYREEFLPAFPNGLAPSRYWT